MKNSFKTCAELNFCQRPGSLDTRYLTRVISLARNLWGCKTWSFSPWLATILHNPKFTTLSFYSQGEKKICIFQSYFCKLRTYGVGSKVINWHFSLLGNERYPFGKLIKPIWYSFLNLRNFIHTPVIIKLTNSANCYFP